VSESGDQSIDEIMDGRAWDAFCDGLKAARSVIFDQSTADNAFDRAEGYRYLSRLTRLALEKFVENNDPLVPRLYQLSREDAKIGADNPDAYYQNACLSGQHEYRLWGNRNSVFYLGIGTYTGNYGSSEASGRSGYIEGDDLEIADDGSFEIILSTKPHAGNWLPMEPETSSLIVRQFFLNRENEQRAELHIERIDAQGPPAPLDPSTLAQALKDSAAFVNGTARIFAGWTDMFIKRPNELNLMPLEKRESAHMDPNQPFFYHGYWTLAADEALLVSAKEPECRYWNFQVNNIWMESLDYRYHRITLNKHSVFRDDDGFFTIVVAHRDPGVRNWIDTAGHSHGTMGLRWNAALNPPRPDCRVVKLSELGNQIKPATNGR
jgi:hypothetical protein